MLLSLSSWEKEFHDMSPGIHERGSNISRHGPEWTTTTFDKTKSKSERSTRSFFGLSFFNRPADGSRDEGAVFRAQLNQPDQIQQNLSEELSTRCEEPGRFNASEWKSGFELCKVQLWFH